MKQSSDRERSKKEKYCYIREGDEDVLINASVTILLGENIKWFVSIF
jgi:hypothetical protein